MDANAIVTIQFFTIVVTILGFAATAERQKELLDNQKRIEKYRFVVQRKVRLMEEFSSFLTRQQKNIYLAFGYGLTKINKKNKSYLTKKWQEEFENIYFETLKDSLLKSYYSGLCASWDTEFSGEMQGTFLDYSDALFDILTLHDQDLRRMDRMRKAGKNRHETAPSLVKLDNAYSELQLRVEELIQTVSGEL